MQIKTARSRPAVELLAELTAAQVLDREQAATVLAEARSAGAGGEAGPFANFLVARGLLTSHQADRAVAGQSELLLVGPYLLAEPLGAVGLGANYLAVRRADQKTFAVKVFTPRTAWKTARARSQADAFNGQRPHPAVVPLEDVGSADGVIYLAWPLVEGESFDKLIRRSGPLDPGRAARLAAQVADGLAACHRCGVAHGMVKPSNLMLGPEDTVQVLELGSGAVASENVTDPAALIDSRSVGGWVDCAAPEVLADPTRLAPAGDAYGLGCVLYFLLTGSYPFPDGTAADKMAAHRSDEPAPVRSRRKQVPDSLAELVSRLMRKDPADRPDDLTRVRDALLKAATDPPSASPPPSQKAPPRDRPATRPRRRGFSTPAPIPGLTAPPPAPAEPEEVALQAVEQPKPTPLPPSFWRRVTRKVFPWGAAPEPLQLSVFGPTGLAHGQTTRFEIYVHTPEEVAEVRAQNWLSMPEGGLLTSGHTAEPIPKSGEVWVHLAAEGVVVTHPMAKFPWKGETHLAPFFIHVPSWSRTRGPVPATVTVGLDGFEVAVLRFMLTAHPPAGK